MNEREKVLDWNVAEVRSLVRDLFDPSPLIYWTDFLLSCSALWAGIIGAGASSPGSWAFVFSLGLGVVGGYRAVLFVHEIAHFRTGSVPGFTVVWNFLCGIPMCVPSFMYRGSHNDHHSRLLYSTKDDGEYVPFARQPKARILAYLFTPIVSPLLLAARFAVLAPASWVIPSCRKIVVTQLSSLVIDFEYVRSEPKAQEKQEWHWQEPLATAFALTVILSVALGWISAQYLLSWYLIAALIFAINSLRTVVAHRYELSGDPVSVQEQYVDSVNIVGQTWLSVFFCPVGLRFHALHHLFPTMPYHQLPKAHARLMAKLPATSPYHLANEESLWSALRVLWRKAKGAANKEGEAASLMPKFFGSTAATVAAEVAPTKKAIQQEAQFPG